jgi:uncharacterized protein
MSEENVEIVRRIADGFNRGDPAVLRWVDPEVEVEFKAQPLGGKGEGRGHEDLLNMLAVFWDYFDEPHMEIEECIESGDGVVIGVRAFGRGKASGVEVNMRLGQVVALREGKVVRWRVFNTMAEALEAAGLSEDEADGSSS